MRGFGHWPSPLPREWLRFPDCGCSRLMKFTPDGSRGSSWCGRHLRAVTRPDRCRSIEAARPGLVSEEMSYGQRCHAGPSAG